MVKVVDSRGRGYEVSVLGSLLPSPSRPAVRKVERKDRKASNKSSNQSEGDDKKKEKGRNTAPPPKKASSRVKARKANARLGDWTEDHDEQLLKLKDVDEKKWLEIVLSMGKPKDLLTERYYELKANRGTEKAAASGSSEASSSQGSAAPPGSWSGAANATDSDEDSWSATDPTDCITEPEPQPPVLDIGDKALTMGETRFAVRLNDYLEEQKWLLLASKLFDKTGKRFSPEALKQGLSGD